MRRRPAIVQLPENAPCAGLDSRTSVRHHLLDHKAELPLQVGVTTGDAGQNGHRKYPDGNRGVHCGKVPETDLRHRPLEPRRDVDRLKNPDDVPTDGVMDAGFLHPGDQTRKVRDHQPGVALGAERNHPRRPLCHDGVSVRETADEAAEAARVRSDPRGEPVGLRP